MKPGDPDRRGTSGGVRRAGRAAPVARTGADTVAPERLRVAVVSDATPRRNGVGTYYDDLVQHLQGRVKSVRLVSPPPMAEEATGGWRLSMPGDPTQVLFIPWLPRLWREIRTPPPDVIVAPTPGLYGLLAMAAARRLGAAFCVAYHTEFSKLADLYWGDRAAFGAFARWATRTLDAVMFRRATSVLVHNADLLDSVRERGVDEVELVGTPAPPPFLQRPPAPLRDELVTVTFVGRLAPEKRVGRVLEAARALPDVRFRFVGDGPMREEVAACAREAGNVELLGWVERERVLDVLDDTDLVVLPSRHETFGTAAFEGMTRRRPALVSPSCGIVEWPELADGLFRMEPGETLVAAIRRIRALPAAERRRVAERGRAAAMALSARTVDHWVEVLAGVAARVAGE